MHLCCKAEFKYKITIIWEQHICQMSYGRSDWSIASSMSLLLDPNIITTIVKRIKIYLKAKQLVTCNSS